MRWLLLCSLLPLPLHWPYKFHLTRLAPPHRPGTPKTNTTFFCESISGNCFLLRLSETERLAFYDAADTCAGFVGGNLVVYGNRGKQMLVGRAHSKHAGALLDASCRCWCSSACKQRGVHLCRCRHGGPASA